MLLSSNTNHFSDHLLKRERERKKTAAINLDNKSIPNWSLHIAQTPLFFFFFSLSLNSTGLKFVKHA